MEVASASATLVRFTLDILKSGNANLHAEGMCLSQNSTRAILYSSTFTRSSATLASRLLVTENFAQDALDLERTLSPPFLATAGVLFILGLISLSFLRVSSKSDASSYTAPGTSKWASRRSSLTFALVWISTSIAFVVAYTTTLTLSALVFAPSSGSQSTFQPTRGITLEALQWLIFGFSVLFSLGFSRIMRLHSSAAPAAGGDYPDLIPVAWPDLRLAEDLGYLHLHLHRSTKSYERKNYFRQRDAAQRNQCNGCKLNFQLVVKQIHVPHLLCE